jgi:hypothetical protein
VVLGEDERDGVALRQLAAGPSVHRGGLEVAQEGRASRRFGPHRLVGEVLLLAIEGEEPKSAGVAVGQTIEGFDQGRGIGGGHGQCRGWTGLLDWLVFHPEGEAQTRRTGRTSKKEPEKRPLFRRRGPLCQAAEAMEALGTVDEKPTGRPIPEDEADTLLPAGATTRADGIVPRCHTFSVSDVRAASDPLPEVSPREALEALIGGPVEALYTPSAPLARAYGVRPSPNPKEPDVPYHPFVAAVHAAFDQHRPLILTPDAVWLMIAQGLALHIGAHAEALRQVIVPGSEGRETLRVRRDDFVKGRSRATRGPRSSARSPSRSARAPAICTRSWWRTSAPRTRPHAPPVRWCCSPQRSPTSSFSS